MANEITAAGSLTASKGGSTATLAVTRTRTLTGVGIHSQTLTIGTAAAEQITWPGDLTSEGITEIMVKNLDTTNYVMLGKTLDSTVLDTDYLLIKVSASGFVIFTPESGNPTLYAQANSSACNIIVEAVGT